MQNANNKTFIKPLLKEQEGTKTQIHEAKEEKRKQLDKKWFSKTNPCGFDCVFSPITNWSKNKLEKNTSLISKRV